jgi:hypothetical protein
LVANSAISRQVTLAISDGFRTIVLPAARAAATFHCNFTYVLVRALNLVGLSSKFSVPDRLSEYEEVRSRKGGVIMWRRELSHAGEIHDPGHLNYVLSRQLNPGRLHLKVQGPLKIHLLNCRKCYSSFIVNGHL